MHVFQAGGSCLSLLTARSAEGFSDLDNIIQESESQYNDREYDWIQSNYGCSQRGEGLDLISSPGFLYSVLALTGLARNFVGWSMLYFGWIIMSRLLGRRLSIFIYINIYLPHCILVYLFAWGVGVGGWWCWRGPAGLGWAKRLGGKKGSSACPVSARSFGPFGFPLQRPTQQLRGLGRSG